MAAAAGNAMQTALQLFTGFKGQGDLAKIYIEAQSDFTKDELTTFTATFIKFDVNKSGDLDEFELNRMYEARGETKTSSELKALIKSVGTEFKDALKANGVSYNAFLSILLKDKKGISKTEWGSFTKAIKKHDDSKKTGAIANKFEALASKGDDAERKRLADLQLKRELANLRKEEEARKAKKKVALAQFAANINKPAAAAAPAAAPAGGGAAAKK